MSGNKQVTISARKYQANFMILNIKHLIQNVFSFEGCKEGGWGWHDLIIVGTPPGIVLLYH